MAISRKVHTELGYYADFESRVADIPADFQGLGYYSRTSIEDVVNNFIVAYTGDGKIISKVPKYEVEFWAQRCMQEFSYDILRSEKSIEIELGPAGQFPLPQDYVNLTKITLTTAEGSNILLMPAKNVTNGTSFLQDGTYNYLFDPFAGNNQTVRDTEGIQRFQAAVPDGGNAQDYYDNNYNGDNFSYFNARFGSNPSQLNSSGTYFIDNDAGVVFFDSSIERGTDSLINFHYISDGLADNGNLSTVFIPKLAEDAMYASILYNLCKVRPSAGNAVALYKKEASSKMRNTKIRLQDYDMAEMAQVMRGKAKWIKH